jgi:hypothetical protein
MAVEVGGNCLTSVDVRLGHVAKWPFSMACIHVDNEGEKQQA